MKQKKILVVDDEIRIRQILRSLLEENGYQVEEAGNGVEALEVSSEFDPDMILLDMKMPKMDGQTLLKHLHEGASTAKILILTAFGSIEEAVNSVKAGAYDYVTKPFVSQDLLQKIERALSHSDLEKELEQTRKQLDNENSFGGIIGTGKTMQNLFSLIARVAKADAPVLITGESGTGKEMVARAIHQHSNRNGEHFLAVNASALPENLIESELFGYLKGSFSGASSDRRGLLAEADGGTLFLDEISEMPLPLQAKLLRFTQAGEFLPIGGREVVRADVRLLAASNRDIESQVAEGDFREDLYYRLNVVRLEVPPLRERKEDIMPLVHHFLKKHGSQVSAPSYTLSRDLKEALLDHDWPGNVRELENAVRSILALSDSGKLTADDLPANLLKRKEKQPGAATPQTLESGRETGERRAVIAALEETGGNRTHAARKLGVSRVTLLKKIKKFGLE